MRVDRRAGAALADIAVVTVFVALGRRSHDEGSALGQVAETSLPFMLGLAVAWIVTRAWRRPTALQVGVRVWVVTVAAGMVLRRLVFDDGTAPSFVVVAGVFNGLGMVGWRWAVWARARRSARSVAAGATRSNSSTGPGQRDVF